MTWQLSARQQLNQWLERIVLQEEWMSLKAGLQSIIKFQTLPNLTNKFASPASNLLTTHSNNLVVFAVAGCLLTRSPLLLHAQQHTGPDIGCFGVGSLLPLSTHSLSLSDLSRPPPKSIKLNNNKFRILSTKWPSEVSPSLWLSLS